MAEFWPRLKKKLACDARRRKKSSKSRKANLYASSGLEKFATLVEDVRGTRASSLVERTGTSVSAARFLSRSAQEWTASTLARTASRRSDSREGSKSPEIVLLHCAVRPNDGQTRSSEYTESFSFAVAGFSPRGEDVEKSETGSASVCESVSPRVGSLHRDLGNFSEDRQFQGGNFMEEASPSATLSAVLPVKTGRCMKKIRSLHRSRWKQTSNLAFVVLVAVGAFISSRFGKVRNQLEAVLTFSAVARIWRRGKLYARFMFSSVALYFLTPLRSYLSYCPRRLSLLPRKLKVIADTKSRLLTNEVSRNLEIEVADEGRGSSLEISVVPLESAPSAANKHGAPLLVLLTIPESSAAPAETPASSGIEPIRATVFYNENGALSPSRRLAKKLSSRFKKLRMFRSSSSSSVSLLSGSESSLASLDHSGRHFTGSSESGSPSPPSWHASAASSPDRHRKCPFSLRLHKSKSDIPSEAHSDMASTVHATEKKLSGKKSRLWRTSSTEIVDIGDIAGCSNDITLTSHPPAAEEATIASRNVSWPVVGLLVTLLFLLVGRLPAIMATSLFLVVSNSHYDRAHPRSRGRETRASEAARKLHRSPPPRRHPGSPPSRY